MSKAKPEKLKRSRDSDTVIAAIINLTANNRLHWRLEEGSDDWRQFYTAKLPVGFPGCTTACAEFIPWWPLFTASEWGISITEQNDAHVDVKWLQLTKWQRLRLKWLITQKLFSWDTMIFPNFEQLLRRLGFGYRSLPQ